MAKLAFGIFLATLGFYAVLLVEYFFCGIFIYCYSFFFTTYTHSVNSIFINYALNTITENKDLLINFDITLGHTVVYTFVMTNLIYFYIASYPVIIIVSCLFLSFLGLRGTFELFFWNLVVFWFSMLYHNYNYFFLGLHTKIKIADLFTIYNTVVSFDLNIDLLSFSFAFLTISIALFTVAYAYSYFRNEPYLIRLLIFINMFVYGMLLLVFANNVIIMLLGWELIGAASFLLINFWFTKVASLKSALKAFSFNKYSDCCILIFCLLATSCVKTIDIAALNLINDSSATVISIFKVNISIKEVLSFFLMSAACIKSAQIFCHIWLPDSMDAPVPASALIHSATLVSAGIYLMLRFHFILENSWLYTNVLPFVAVTTALYGGVVSAFQTDLKKILAYSTISHCGFLMLLTCQNVIEFTLIYLYVHGFFKACSFLCVGNIIRFNKNVQDLRLAGQFWKYLIFEFSALIICLFNLAGLPFTIGFISKHFLFLNNFNFFFEYIFLTLLFLSLFCGIFYALKILFYAFFDVKKADKTTYKITQYILKSNLFIFTNSTYGSIIPITLLILTAYLTIALQLFYWIILGGLHADIYVTFVIDQYFLIGSKNNFLIKNFSLFFWIVNFFLTLYSVSSWVKKFKPSTATLSFVLLIQLLFFIFLLKFFF